MAGTQIEVKISNCSVCEKERVLHLEPLQPTKMLDYPWIRMDLFEWKGHQYLLVVDYFSQWIEIAHLTQTTSSAVIEHVKAIFVLQGIPEVVVSDNGAQFNSSLREFLRKLWFHPSYQQSTASPGKQ